MRNSAEKLILPLLHSPFFIILTLSRRGSVYAAELTDTTAGLSSPTDYSLSLRDLVMNNTIAFSVIILLLAAQSVVIFLLQRSRLKHKRLEKELQKSEEKYKNLISDIHESVLIINTYGIITFSSNGENRHNTKYRDRLTGYHFTSLVHPDDVDMVKEKFKECFINDIKPFILRTLDDDGNIMYLRTSARKLTDDNIVTGLIVLLVDITDIKKKEKLLNDARMEAEEANSIKYRFLANISHELRTPLNAIMGMSELLFEMETSESKKGLVAIIKSSGNNLLTIINDILNFSKIDGCNLNENDEVFSLKKTIDEAAGMFKIDMEMKEIIFYKEVDEHLPDNYTGDRKIIRQIFVNLISNAVKFTDSGSIRLTVFSKHLEGNILSLVIEIEDTGIGIPDKDKDRIFQNFYQSGVTSGRIYPGTGMGLAIIKKIVEMMNGTISVRNSMKRGSIFKVEIDLTVSDKVFSDVFINDDEENKHSIAKRILLVEDNLTNQTLTRIFLEKMNFSVETASNGLEALNAINRYKFDAVLMDCQMPVMDGYEASEEIRKLDNHKDIPIIALTAYAFEEDRKKCLTSGMNDFITKPVNRTILYNTLNKWI